MPYKVFTTPGADEWDWAAAGKPQTVSVLLVGGGGGGGGRNTGAGGGGGAGGVLELTAFAVADHVQPDETINVAVGAGGAGVLSGHGQDGAESSFGGVSAGASPETVAGGGGGGYGSNAATRHGRDGASGGGGAGSDESNGTGGTGSVGNDGGDAFDAFGGGGGGQGAAGEDASVTSRGAGGDGVATPALFTAAAGAPSVLAAGGAGGTVGDRDASDAEANSGSGGDGRSTNNATVGDGADGIVIIWWGEERNVRLNIREDVGAIITATGISRSDVSASLEFFPGVDLAVGELQPLVETLAPGEVRHRVYAHEEQTRSGLVRYAGTTILSRMARTYPEATFARVQDISELSGDLFDAGDGEGAIYVTPQKAIDYVLTQWAGALDWFGFEAVPDLRLKAPSPDQAGFATPTEYSNDATLGRVPCPVLQFPQNDDDERNMRAILDELLSPFPGTIYRQNSSGRLEIVPTYGPDADESPVVTLTDSDVLSVTEGEGDTRTIANAAIVESQPYTRQEDIGAMSDAWFQIAAQGIAEDDYYDTGTGIAIGDGRDGLKPAPIPRIWPVDSERIPDGDTIKLTDSGGTKIVTVDWKTPENGNSGTFQDSEVTLTDIPKDGTPVDAVVVSGFAGIGFTLRARWVTAREGGPGIKLFAQEVRLRSIVLGNYDDWIVRVNLADATTAWELGSTTITGEFGFDEEDTLPGSDGGNALEQSRGRFERVVDRTSSTGYGLVEGSVLVDVARAHVMETITPQLIREVSLAPWRDYPVTFDHIGRLVELPSGEQGIVIGRAYEASFGSIDSPGSISCSLRVQVRNATGVGAIDVDTDYLLMDDGTYFILDDGSIAEAG